MPEISTRLMLGALRKMADDPKGQVRTYGPDRAHLQTLEALVARGLARWAPIAPSGGTPVHAEITEAGRDVLRDPDHAIPPAEENAAPELDPSQGAQGAQP